MMNRWVWLATLALASGCTHEYYFGEPESADASSGPEDNDEGGDDPDAEPDDDPDAEPDDDPDAEPDDDDDHDDADGDEVEVDLAAAYVTADDGDIELRIVRRTEGSHCSVLILEDSEPDGDPDAGPLELPLGWSLERFGVVDADDCDLEGSFDTLQGSDAFVLDGQVEFPDEAQAPVPCGVDVEVEFTGIDAAAGLEYEALFDEDLNPDNCG